MIRSLWIARTGLDAQQTQLDVISNNLANISTNGLPAGPGGLEKPAVPDPASAGGAIAAASTSPTGLPVGSTVYTQLSTARIFTSNIQKTDSTLDVAVQGNGFFRCLCPTSTIGYAAMVPSRG